MEELGNSIPLAEGMVDAESGNKKDAISDTCLNCGTPLTGTYCTLCGQKNIPRRQTLGELIENFLGSFFSYESKFFRTIKFLLFKPGFLVVEYNSGRRERYYHPARMYVFVSFIYFLLFLSLPDSEERNDTMQSDKTENVEDDSDFDINGVHYENRESYDSIQATLAPEKRDGWMMRKLNYRALELRNKFQNNGEQFSKAIGDSFTANSPKVFFFLLPIFALLLKLLYIRRDFFYSEHLVMSIYFYNFFFAIGIIGLLLETIPMLDWISVVIFFVVLFYLLKAMKTVYRQGWWKTFAKLFLLSFIFSVCIGFGLAINLVITLMLI